MKLLTWTLLTFFCGIFIVACSFIELNHPTIEWFYKPCFKPLNKYNYILCRNLIIKIDNKFLTISEGFISDMASIPKVLWPFISPQYSGFVYPSIVHDYLYRCPMGISRQLADKVFYAALLNEGISNFTAQKMYYAVRIFGKNYFQTGHDCRFEDIQEINARRKLNRNEPYQVYPPTDNCPKNDRLNELGLLT